MQRLEMALHDRDILRTMAFGIAGLSVVADSLSARYTPRQRCTSSATLTDWPWTIGSTARSPPSAMPDLRRWTILPLPIFRVTLRMSKIRKHPTYRNAVHTQSVLTITSNVVYGKHTGNTPDGRRTGDPFGPGANPMHGRDKHGWLASCLSVAAGCLYADMRRGRHQLHRQHRADHGTAADSDWIPRSRMRCGL